MKTADVIRIDHFYSHAPSAVWRALTDPALLERWWVAGDVRPIVGHRFELDMGQWGKQPCEVLEVEQERLLRYRFAAGALDSIVTWQLIPEGAGTRLRLSHEGFNLDSPLGRKALEGMKPGWPRVLERLETLLASTGRVDSDAGDHATRVALVPGAAGCAAFWTPITERLPDDWSVTAIDPDS